MSEPAQTLEIVEVPIAEIARPTHSLILADRGFMSTLIKVEAQVASMKITDAQSAQAAADLLSRLTTAGTALEKQRVQLKAPYLALMKLVDESAKIPAGRIEVAKKTLSKAQTDFALLQARLAREAEEKRLADLKALEEKLANEKAEADRKAQEIADQLKREQEAADRVREAARVAGIPIAEEEDWGEAAPAPDPEPVQKSETEKAIEAVRYAPAPVVVKSAGVREVVTLYPRVVDINLVPDMFVTKTFKLAAVQSTFTRSWKEGDKMPECPGVEFQIQRAVVSTGKAGF